ncbi:putative NLR Family CARD Domain Containing protein [Blattamonas nauphoetae]|uniref:NLR Family CARD Domain Containing protein n=1 Tax=Blattamonas nauphoetae TaxID=2049346 RepID=A0ABQ9XGV7_9EUKA|nr:putative NLR Family CARD Domain Containing protein [Blattamonas nauphoetae]
MNKFDISLDFGEELEKPAEQGCPFTDSECVALYQAKCLDLKKEKVEVQQDRFIMSLRTNCAGSILNLSQTGLGPNTMAILADLLKTCDQFSVVDLSSNQIRDKGVQHLSTIFSNGNSSIVHLDLRSNDIGPAGATSLFTSLLKNSTLTAIDLSSIAGANRNHIGSAATSVAEFLAQNQVLSYLNLESNSITVDGLVAISQALAVFNTTLSHLELSNNSFGSDGATLMGSLLPQSSLRFLGFSGNSIGDKGVIEIARGLFEAPEEIVEAVEKKQQEKKEKKRKQMEKMGLSLDEDVGDAKQEANPSPTVSPMMDEEEEEKKSKYTEEELRGMLNMELDSIYEALLPPLIIERQKKPKQKERLSLCGGVNGRTVAEVIEEAVVPIEEYDEEDTEDEDIAALKLSCLSHITLANNKITERGMKVFAVALMKNRFLTTVDLSNNKAGEVGGLAIAEMIKTNKTITTLTLNNCKIGNVAGKAVCEAFAWNTTMERVDLSHNNLQNEGAEGLANAFRSNKICQLTHLNMSSNGMKDKGGMALSGALATNDRLRHMNLASNDLTNNTVNSLISTLRTNTCLQTVDFRFNDCSHLLLSSLKELLDKNTGWKKDGFSESVRSDLVSLRQDVDQLDELRSLTASESATLLERCRFLVSQHLLLIETQRECEGKERELLEQLDVGAKLVITLGEETKELAKKKEEERKDGEFRARTLTTEANRRAQERSEAERKRKKTIRQLEDMGEEVVAKTEEMGLVSSYGVEAVGSVGSGQRVVSSHEELRTGRSSNGEEPFSEEPKLTVKIARQMRVEMDEAVVIGQRKLEMIKNKQWKVGDPLPFELMTEREKKESIRKKAEAEERARKLEMSALLESTGLLPSPSTGSHGDVQGSARGEGQAGEGSREETEETSA